VELNEQQQPAAATAPAAATVAFSRSRWRYLKCAHAFRKQLVEVGDFLEEKKDDEARGSCIHQTLF